jgi:hypothetical protein
MAISTLDTVLETLKDDIIDKLVAGSVYDTTPKVSRGEVAWSETDGKRPFIWFMPTQGTFDEIMGGTALNTINIELHGYADRKGSTDNIHKLFKDIQYFLLNDFSLSGDTYLDDYVIDEGAVGDSTGMSGFLLNLHINYNHTITSI